MYFRIVHGTACGGIVFWGRQDGTETAKCKSSQPSGGVERAGRHLRRSRHGNNPGDHPGAEIMLNDFKRGCPAYLARGYTDPRRGGAQFFRSKAALIAQMAQRSSAWWTEPQTGQVISLLLAANRLTRSQFGQR